jgi:hypothetical protein
MRRARGESNDGREKDISACLGLLRNNTPLFVGQGIIITLFFLIFIPLVSYILRLMLDISVSAMLHHIIYRVSVEPNEYCFDSIAVPDGKLVSIV